MRIALTILALAASLILWFANQSHNPPGFYVDEASIGLNALTIARNGVDEHGIAYPLFFRAFGEYKSPAYIYLLAGVFDAFDPSPLAARRLSAILGWLAALLLGLLGWRMTKRLDVAITTFALAIATPALFEISRLAFEVALFPLAVALFLLLAWQARVSPRWSQLLIGALALTLSLVMYTYTAGRLLGPLYALLLLLLAERKRDVVAVWVLFALLAVVPSLIYHQQNDGALTKRAGDTSIVAFIAEDPMRGTIAFYENVRGVLIPWEIALRGDPDERHHVPSSGGSILLATLLLAPLGLALDYEKRWTLFLLLGGLASVLPAMMSRSVQHSLRYSAWPPFLIAMCIGALASRRFRGFVRIALALAVVQALWFFTTFHRAGAARTEAFEAGIPQVVHAALAQPSRPLYVRHLPDYAHTLWWASLKGVPLDQFIKLEKGVHPPPNAISVDSRQPDEQCTVLAKWQAFRAYRCP